MVRPKGTLFSDQFGSLFSSSAQDDYGSIKIGMLLEDVVTGPFMAALDFADQVALNYKHATHYLTRQEEVCSNTINKAIDMFTFLDHDISVPYFKGDQHNFVATQELQESLIELTDYSQDLANNIHQAITTAYYKATSISSKVMMLKHQVNHCTAPTCQKCSDIFNL
jgi:hypothetical protein